jgi:uncharacterized protein (TIGR00369 family)
MAKKSGRWHAPDMGRLPQEGTWEERLEYVRSRWSLHPFWKLLGLEPAALGPGYGKIRVLFDRERHGPWPHGGLLAALVDTSIVLALFTTYGPGDEDVVAHATTDLNVTFLGSMEGDELYGEGRILRRARNAAFGASEVRDDRGVLVAVGRASFLIRRKGAADP